MSQAVLAGLQEGPLRHDAGGKARPRWRPGTVVKADFAGPLDCYRLSLSETWDTTLPAVMFQMMNPSTAGLENSDPTLMKTGGFARRWGFGAQLIGNDHAYRATDKMQLLEVADPVGPGNDEAILAMAARADMIVLAQGQPPKPLRERSWQVVVMLIKAGHGRKLHYLRAAKDSQSFWHPLYLPNSAQPIVFDPALTARTGPA